MLLLLSEASVTDRGGVTAVEYGVIAVGIVLVVATSATTLGGRISTLFASIASTVDRALSRTGEGWIICLLPDASERAVSL
jgi:pilus assembly protein Flp/PilA